MKKININKRRKLFMKKNALIKGILILAVIALLTIGFTGCGTVIPPSCTTATVNIDIVNDSWTYWIDIDGFYWLTTNSAGYATIYNVPTGYHTFYALATDYMYEGWVYNVNISCGVNNLVIPVY
jgi:hypothetical protein